MFVPHSTILVEGLVAAGVIGERAVACILPIAWLVGSGSPGVLKPAGAKRASLSSTQSRRTIVVSAAPKILSASASDSNTSPRYSAMAHATTLGLGGAPRRDRIGGSASFICLITERASARSAAVGLPPGEPPGSWLELEASSFIRGAVRARTRRPPLVELRRPLSQGSMAHHGWGALTGRWHRSWTKASARAIRITFAESLTASLTTAIAKKARAGVKRGPFRKTTVPAPSHSMVHAAQTGCHARRELPLRSLLTRHSQLCGEHTQAQARAQT